MPKNIIKGLIRSQLVWKVVFHSSLGLIQWQGSSIKKIILGYNKNYVILALNYILKNSKRKISVLGVKRKDSNNSIKRRNKHIKSLKELLWIQKNIVRKNIKKNI